MSNEFTGSGDHTQIKTVDPGDRPVRSKPGKEKFAISSSEQEISDNELHDPWYTAMSISPVPA
jgi:hypothetical protein